MRTSAEISDTIQYAGPGIFERRPLNEWRIPDTPTDGVPDYTPMPWERGGDLRRNQPEQSYVRIEAPSDMPEMPKPEDRMPTEGTVRIDYSIARQAAYTPRYQV